jgi:4-hydroxy-2-oxoheptanedioate aldolase
VLFLNERLAREGAVLNRVLAAIPSAVAAQAVASAGAEFLLVDREHGPIGRESLHAMIAATAGTACGALVRVPAIDAAEVKLALDCGAEGVSFPMVRSAADAERCGALLRSPPRGSRG